jgi:hypothetical protein
MTRKTGDLRGGFPRCAAEAAAQPEIDTDRRYNRGKR